VNAAVVRLNREKCLNEKMSTEFFLFLSFRPQEQEAFSLIAQLESALTG
jgi:hypothetical protein